MIVEPDRPGSQFYIIISISSLLQKIISLSLFFVVYYRKKPYHSENA